MNAFRRSIALLCALCTLLACCAAYAAEDLTPYFESALAALRTPAEIGMETGEYVLRTGDSAYVPDVAPAITPFDEQENTVYPAVNGSFTSDDPSVVTVSDKGLMTAAQPGMTVVCYHAADGDHSYLITVSDDAMPETVKNYVYVIKREFYSVQRARLPKYNQYAKWYYGKKKEVGWCSVFTIYCANASGNNPIKEKELDLVNTPVVQYLREGQVGNQYDGFMAMNRFVSVPKPGYLVIYADMSNAYRTVHIASVADVVDRGDGVYQVTTIEGNMSNSVKSYCYLYDSKLDNHLVGTEKKLKLRYNMSELPQGEQTDPLVQYALHTDHWSVFGFCQTWQ